MNKKLFFTAVLLIFTMLSSIASVKSGYSTLYRKARTCSPYIYNEDGDAGIMQILGWYNRRCIVRILTQTGTAECKFRTSEVKTFYSSLMPPKYYQPNIFSLIDFLQAEDKKSAANYVGTFLNYHDKFLNSFKNFGASGTCVKISDEKTENQENK